MESAASNRSFRPQRSLKRTKFSGQRVGYIRLPKLDRPIEQAIALKDRAELAACCSQVVLEKAGVKELPQKRPQLCALVERLQRGDCLVVVALDRLGPKLPDVMAFINDCHRRGVQVQSRDGLNTAALGRTATPLLEALTALTKLQGPLSETVETIQVSVAKGSPKLSQEAVVKVEELLSRGWPYRRITKYTGVSHGSVSKIARSMHWFSHRRRPGMGIRA